MFPSDRKRKQQQDDCKHLSSSMPTSSWSDFIYSSPSSPTTQNPVDHHFNFDTFFEQHQIHNLDHNATHSGTNSRRHSVAVGEMDYHSFDINKELNILPQSGFDDLQLLLNSTAQQPSSERPIHRRTMSLREDDPHFATLLSPTMPTTPHFFSSSFLDALVAENASTTSGDAATIMSDLSFMDNVSTSLHETVTPSAISNEINTMADWLLEQEEVQKAQKRQRTSLSPVSPTTGSSASTTSPSPPITPMQPASLGFEPEWDMTNLLNNKSGLITARILQGESSASALKPLIQDYLVVREHQQDRSVPVAGERTVMVLTSRVAQKSYGTEKRFLCPPPTTVLKGAHWWTSPENHDNFHAPSTFNQPPKLTIHISGESISQTGVMEWATTNGTMIDNMVNHNQHVTGRCVSKQLYINDADEKRKRVEVLAKLQLGNGVPLGTFPSKGIKVISKPSKKRQSIKNMELCIHHGTTISLFNRIRSQTVSTKYLGVSGGTSSTQQSNNGTCFVARTGSWDPFVIWIVDTSRSPDTTSIPRPQQHHPNNPNFPPPPAIALQTPSSTSQPVAIHYNQPVVLQCVTTGLVSPVMVIRKVDKGSMVLGGNRLDDASSKTGGECGDETLGDPVSQLHKIAFQIVQDPTFSQQRRFSSVIPSTNAYQIPQSCHPVTYLACLNDVVGMHKTTYQRHLIPTCQNVSEAVVEESKQRRRMSSISSTDSIKRRGSMDTRRGSTTLDTSGLEGACWTEDVSDAAVWTIVGTDCASYTFWTPNQANFNNPFSASSATPITPFPLVSDCTHNKQSLTVAGENLTRDLVVWFGDIKADTEYKSREGLSCQIPSVNDLINSPCCLIQDDQKKIPLLLVRGDGVVYRTDQFYYF